MFALTPIRSPEAPEVCTWRHDPHLLRLVVIVELVLLLDLVGGRNDHQLRGSQSLLFGVDAARHVVSLLDRLGGQT